MRILLAPDSFKGSLSATQVCAALSAGLTGARADLEVVSMPMADGGEGTLDAIGARQGLTFFDALVHGPLGELTPARYGVLGDEALIETALACGLPLTRGKLDPIRAGTRGVGEIIRAALERGLGTITCFLGGSATIDAGTGLLRELGFGLLDASGDPIPVGGGGLVHLARIAPPAVALEGTRFVAACDVENPLLGADGAARVYGPQKGADARQVELLETGLARFAEVIARDFGVDVDVPRAGAAGGMAAGLAGALGAQLVSGGDCVADHVGLDAALERCDMVVTGEGRTDAQSAFGKVCAGVARRARRHAIPCVLVSGKIAPDFDARVALGVREATGLSPEGETLELALRYTERRLRETGRSFADRIEALTSVVRRPRR